MEAMLEAGRPRGKAPRGYSAHTEGSAFHTQVARPATASPAPTGTSSRSASPSEAARYLGYELSPQCRSEPAIAPASPCRKAAEPTTSRADRAEAP